MSSAEYGTMAACHVVTGLKPLGMKLLRKAGFSSTNPTLNDPRASILAAVLASDTDKDLKGNSGIPDKLAKALASSHEGQSILEAIV